MPRQSKQKPARHRVPHQIDLFAEGPQDDHADAYLVRAADGDTGSSHPPDYATNPGSRRQSSDRLADRRRR
jgi:hypothetical protein